MNNWLIPDMQEGDVKEFILDLAQTISINRKDELYSKYYIVVIYSLTFKFTFVP